MQPALARILAVALMGGVFASVAEAAIIRGSGTFEIVLEGEEEDGQVFDPPLLGSGSFEIRSRPYDPDEVSDVFDFEVLDFSFGMAGFTWDTSDIQDTSFGFTPDGEPLSIYFEFDNGVASGFLGFGFEGDIFAMGLLGPNLEAGGDSDSQTAGVDDYDFTFVVAEPGTVALLSLGLLGLGLTRRRAAN